MNGASLTPPTRPPRRPRDGGGAALWIVVAFAAVVVLAVVVGAVASRHFSRALGSDHLASHGPAPSATATASPAPGTTASPSSAATEVPSPGASDAGTSPSPASSPGQGDDVAGLPARPHIVADAPAVPILVYHHVLARPKGPALLVMTPDRFRGQMAWLSAHGYQAVTLRRVYDAWTGEGILPPHPVVITFDDGYADQVRNAAPILRQFHWPAELDLVSSALYVGDHPSPSSLTPEMVQGLIDDGWGLESHSVRHFDLTGLWGRRLHRELYASRSRLEDLFDAPVDFFCYPGGIYNRRVKLAVRRAGYLAATGTRYGAATPRDLFSLPRIYCYRGESPGRFGARLHEILAAARD